MVQLGSGARRLYAYAVGGAVPTRRGQLVGGGGSCCRLFCLPNILLLVLITLFGVATIQVALFHYYGSTVSGGSLGDYNTGSFAGHPYLLHGAGGLMSRYVRTPPPPRVNLAKLLNRNVPSMVAHWRTLKQELNRIALNRLIDDATRTPPSSTPVAHQPPPAAAHGDRHEHEDSPAVVGPAEEQMPAGRRRIAAAAAAVVAAPLTARTPCPIVPPGLKGKLHVEMNHTELPEQFSETAIMATVPLLKPGGVYAPADCISRYHVAIIIPYRDRHDHLMMLLGHLHPILQRQQINYRIFVVEQKGDRTFNKARIMNIAFVEALKKDANYDCFVFHDVDLIPEDDRNLYSCPTEPRHMSPAIDEFGYQNPYDELVGGVLALRTEHFFKVNGYSNLYWGWGAEDDDMAYRIAHVGLRITRPPVSLARYKTVKHKKRPAVDGRIRYRLLYTGVRRYKIDGLNSLPSLNYHIISMRSLPLYTHILVDIGPPPPGF